MARYSIYWESDQQMENIDVVITFSTIDEASQACASFTHLGFYVTYHESMGGTEVKLKLPKQALPEVIHMIQRYGGKMNEGNDLHTSTNQVEQQHNRESYIHIPAHLIHEDWMDEWETIPPEIASDILLSDEESAFDPLRIEHRKYP